MAESGPKLLNVSLSEPPNFTASVSGFHPGALSRPTSIPGIWVSHIAPIQLGEKRVNKTQGHRGASQRETVLQAAVPSFSGSLFYFRRVGRSLDGFRDGSRCRRRTKSEKKQKVGTERPHSVHFHNHTAHNSIFSMGFAPMFVRLQEKLVTRRCDAACPRCVCVLFCSFLFTTPSC